MPGLGTSNEATGDCHEAGPDPRGAEMAVSPEYRMLSDVVSMTRCGYGLDESSLARLQGPVNLAAHRL